jgi:hypothetical protein
MGMKVVQFFRKRPWLLAVFFFLPVVFLVASHFYHADQKNSFATGYLVYDFAYYLSCAREYFDSGGFHFMYGNPFSQLVQSERIYFQPLTFLIGAIWWVSSIPLWLVFYGIGWIAAIACLIVVIRLYDHLFSLNSVDKFLGLIGEVVQFFLGKKDVFKNREIVIIENRLPENPRLVLKKIPAGAVLLHENGPFRIFRRSSQ